MPLLQNIEECTAKGNTNDTRNKNSIEENMIVPVYMGQVLPHDFIRLMDLPTPSISLRQHARKLSEMLPSTLLDDAAKEITDRKDKNPTTTESITAGAVTATNSVINEAETRPSSSLWKYPRLQFPSKIREMNSRGELSKFLGVDDESILILSLMGWKPIPNSSSCANGSTPVISLGCPLCLSMMELRLERRHGLENDKDDNEEDETSRLTKRARTCSRYFNVLDAHRHYCPYKVGFPKKATETNPVWEILLKRLCKEIQLSGKVDFTKIKEAETNFVVPDEVLDDSIKKVRGILRSGIAPEKINLSAFLPYDACAK